MNKPFPPTLVAKPDEPRHASRCSQVVVKKVGGGACSLTQKHLSAFEGLLLSETISNVATFGFELHERIKGAEKQMSVVDKGVEAVLKQPACSHVCLDFSGFSVLEGLNFVSEQVANDSWLFVLSEEFLEQLMDIRPTLAFLRSLLLKNNNSR